MKKIFFKTVCLMATLTIMVITGTGCTIIDSKPKTQPEKTNISIILAPTANEPKPNTALAKNIVYEASYSYAFRNIIIDDGSPFEAVNGDLTCEEHNENLSDANKKLDAEAYTKKFIELANEVSAVTSEKDTAKALKMAADSLNGLDGKKTIVLIDNGISTIGSVAFETFNGFDAQASLEKIDESTLPDLKGINVLWYDFASTLQPQQSLSSNDMVELQKFWDGYLKKAGASDVVIKKAINTNAEVNRGNLPPVSTVEVTEEKGVVVVRDVSDINNEVENAPDDKKNDIVSTVLDNEGIKIDETVLNFKPESAEIANKEAAMELLRPTADYLVNTSQKVVLLGTTATVLSSKDKCIGFSLERANAVKSLLIEMGVDENQILCKGLGYDNPFHINDFDGINLNENAPKNRAVFIYKADSDIGKKYTK